MHEPLVHDLPARWRFVSLRFRFWAMRASFEARVGFVGRRFFWTTSARRTRSARRDSAASRFCCWLRRALETIRSHPSPSRRVASRSMTRGRVASSSTVLCPGFQSSSIRVLDVFTCWPPGAPSSRGPVLELPPRDPEGGCHLQHAFLAHPVTPLLDQSSSERLWQNARIDPPDRLWHFARRAVRLPNRLSDDERGFLLDPDRLVRWVYVGRLSLATAIFLAAVLASQDPDTERRKIVIATLAFTATLAATGLSVIYSGFYRRPLRNAFHYIQAVFDLLLVTAVVHVTTANGTPSQFAALYILVIATSSLLAARGRRAARRGAGQSCSTSPTRSGSSGRRSRSARLAPARRVRDRGARHAPT